MPLAEITDQDLDLNRHLEAVKGPEFGAVATFIGQIRDHDPEASGEVDRLEYSAHPEAESILRKIADELDRPDIRIAVSHRTGTVAVGEPALIACVAAAHRQLAYEVSRELVERIKAEVPIWKHQVAADGSKNWQGLR
jgi:molybdopterin synthase catalytic subunit